MRIGLNEHITNGETWQANVMSVDNYCSQIGDAEKADELAYLFVQTIANGGNPSYYDAVARYINEGIPDISGDLHAMARAVSVHHTDRLRLFPLVQVKRRSLSLDKTALFPV